MSTVAPAFPRITPRFAWVFREQLRLTRKTLLIDAMAIGLLVWTCVLIFDSFIEGPKPYLPIVESGYPLAGFAVALLVWRGERLFDDPHLATLPVDRPLHILARSLAGALWLFGLFAWIVVATSVITLLFGGEVGLDRNFLAGPVGPGGEVTTEALRQIRWTPQAWNWIAPFTLMAIYYLLGTALAIGVRRKLRWLGGLVVLLLVLAVAPGGLSDDGWLAAVLDETIFGGPVGFDYTNQGGMKQLTTRVQLPNLSPTPAWTGLPDMAAWLRATAFWLALSGGLAGLAAWRHRER